MELEWTEPPPEAFISQPGGFYGQVAIELRKRPHEWAILPREFNSAQSAQQTARSINQGRMKAMPLGMYEARCADAKIWVRFHPSDDEAIPPDDDGDSNVVGINGKKHDPAKVRAWLTAQGIEVAERGRLPQDLIAKYAAAHSE